MRASALLTRQSRVSPDSVLGAGETVCTSSFLLEGADGEAGPSVDRLLLAGHWARSFNATDKTIYYY